MKNQKSKIWNYVDLDEKNEKSKIFKLSKYSNYEMKNQTVVSATASKKIYRFFFK